MIVKYSTDRGYKGPGLDPSVSLGTNYVVIMISIARSLEANEPMLCVMHQSDQIPIMIPASCFETVDARLPCDWIYEYTDGGSQTICPSEFKGDFFERYNDGDEVAERLFNTVVSKIQAFHGH